MSRFWALEIASYRKPWIRSLDRTDRLGSLSEARAVLSMARQQAKKVAANMPQHQACLDVIEEGVLFGGQAGVVKVCISYSLFVLVWALITCTSFSYTASWFRFLVKFAHQLCWFQCCA
jgi:enoyl-CoA hydratase/3-hydroxyacyl-CoA dehydrogenase